MRYIPSGIMVNDVGEFSHIVSHPINQSKMALEYGLYNNCLSFTKLLLRRIPMQPIVARAKSVQCNMTLRKSPGERY